MSVIFELRTAFHFRVKTYKAERRINGQIDDCDLHFQVGHETTHCEIQYLSEQLTCFVLKSS